MFFFKKINMSTFSGDSAVHWVVTISSAVGKPYSLGTDVSWAVRYSLANFHGFNKTDSENGVMKLMSEEIRGEKSYRSKIVVITCTYLSSTCFSKFRSMSVGKNAQNTLAGGACRWTGFDAILASINKSDKSGQDVNLSQNILLNLIRMRTVWFSFKKSARSANDTPVPGTRLLGI